MVHIEEADHRVNDVLPDSIGLYQVSLDIDLVARQLT